MHFEKKTVRNIFLVASGCIILYWLLHETERFRTVWNAVTDVTAPFVLGSVLAFILNVPMRAFEKHLHYIENIGLRRTLSILLTFLALVLVVAGVYWLLVPQLTETIQMLIPKVVDFFLGLEKQVYAFLDDNPQLLEWIYANTGLESFDWPGIIQQAVTMLKNSVTVIANGAFSAVGSLAGGVVNAVIGLVFALYSLGRKEILARQGRRVLYAVLPEHFADETIRILRLTNSTFSNFISGQCLEAVILGCLFAVSMAIFRMPYISLISVLIGVTALVPLVGAFIGCILGAFFILVNDPMQALIFIAMFLVLQQIEGNLIYPKVVGTSIGLPGMWVLVAVTVGGEIMGVGGMLMMIPISSVLYTLAREFTNKRVAERNIDPEKLLDHPPELKSKFKENRERKQRQKLMKQMKELAEKAEAAVDHTLHKKEK
ncbi:MAG: AI-2E family transporter [Oscillospiraceae bacterium]|nr:AI-2E family transporter [Oscillospiraceae bacterium]